ncbi:class I SAM-dependent methyltransferase [Nocardioides sp.]|uniref:class I SAM-dependent methyltransferase n=1 Tax=Nocardioides sp. TaxID=35761 RepID=UPI002ED56330
MTHSHHDLDPQDPTAFWEDFYSPGRRPWSGRPNRVLVDELARKPLVPTTALDLGCGTGGDAIWLAAQGWTVTGVDISSAALHQAEQEAEAAGLGDHVTWQRVDLDQGLPVGTWDLVTAAYLQAPVALSRDAVLRAAADAVAPGGTMVVIGHATPPTWATDPPEHMRGMPDADEVLRTLDLSDWTVERAELVTFESTSPDGAVGTRSDSLVRVRRPS